MSYTVKSLAQLSGVSISTIHFYDKIGLLKPARRASNGYRYYEKEQLLLLKEIVFYKDLGIELSEIMIIIENNGDEELAILKRHKDILMHIISDNQKLIEKIDEHIRTLTTPNK